MRTELSVLAVVVLAAFTACGSGETKAKSGNADGGTCADGTERCRCYGNGTCNQGLTCASQHCVNLAGTGGAAGEGVTGGSGGVSSSGGVSGSGGSSVQSGGATATGGADAASGGDAASTGGADAGDGTLSCRDLATTCGPNANASCCASSLVPGGRYNRSNDANYPATVSDFILDTYEVTVGRFRKFVAAYTLDMIPSGAGKNPNNPDDLGWDTSWNVNMPASISALTSPLKCGAPFQTWTDSPGANENRPIDCVSWYLAYAFCVWDGGRLPTEAEWNYAAAGGSEQRIYPWSNPPSSTVIDDSYAVYCGASCNSTQNVGSKSPKGDGKWGQADLAGNVYEWTVDWAARPYAQVPCIDCAYLTGGTERINRSISFNGVAADLVTSRRNSSYPTDYVGLGIRCARNP